MNLKIAVNNSFLSIYQTNSCNGRPTIIFLHDSLGCIEVWRNFPDQLGEAANCNVLVYDRLGYGKSAPFTTSNRKNNYLELEADGLNTLLEQFNLENVILFGHSDGGSISLIAAAKFPSRIKDIITEGAHIFVEDITLKSEIHSVPVLRLHNAYKFPSRMVQKILLTS
jgi:pimeloyl-ACP methyl ester carboxylesterase